MAIKMFKSLFAGAVVPTVFCSFLWPGLKMTLPDLCVKYIINTRGVSSLYLRTFIALSFSLAQFGYPFPSLVLFFSSRVLYSNAQGFFLPRFLAWSAALVAISNTSLTPSLVLAEHSRQPKALMRLAMSRPSSSLTGSCSREKALTGHQYTIT